MKKTTVPALALLFLAVFGVPASAFGKTAEPYDPVKALREGRRHDDRVGLPEKKRDDALSLAFAPEYFWDFGNDLPDADGWGVSLSFSALFDTDRPKWDVVAELELLALWAESGTYTHKGREVTESLHSVNILPHVGLSYSLDEKFRVEALLGLGVGATYGEVKGENFKTSSNGNFTTTVSAKLRAEYRLDENWDLFAAYRFAYISPSIASKVAGWHYLDLFTHSVELGVRYRF